MSINFLDINGRPKTTRVHYSTYAEGAIKLQQSEERYALFTPEIDYYRCPGFTNGCKIYMEFSAAMPSNDSTTIRIPHTKCAVVLKPNENLSMPRVPNKLWHAWNCHFIIYEATKGFDFDVWLTFDFD